MNEQDQKIIPHHKNKHTDDLIDHYWGSINYISSLIKASEIKAGLILSFYGILLNFIYLSAELVVHLAQEHLVVAIFCGLWLCCTVASIYYSIRCFIPRIEAKYDPNIFFFRDVISKFGGITDFAKMFFEISSDEDRLFEQLGQQIFILSTIASYKFMNVNLSLRLLAVGLLLCVVLSTLVLVLS